MRRLWLWLGVHLFPRRVVWIPAQYFRPLTDALPVVGTPYYVIHAADRAVYGWMFCSLTCDFASVVDKADARHAVMLAVLANRWIVSATGYYGERLDGFAIERGRKCFSLPAHPQR